MEIPVSLTERVIYGGRPRSSSLPLRRTVRRAAKISRNLRGASKQNAPTGPTNSCKENTPGNESSMLTLARFLSLVSFISSPSLVRGHANAAVVLQHLFQGLLDPLPHETPASNNQSSSSFLSSLTGLRPNNAGQSQATSRARSPSFSLVPPSTSTSDKPS